MPTIITISSNLWNCFGHKKTDAAGVGRWSRCSCSGPVVSAPLPTGMLNSSFLFFTFPPGCVTLKSVVEAVRNSRPSGVSHHRRYAYSVEKPGSHLRLRSWIGGNEQELSLPLRIYFNNVTRQPMDTLLGCWWACERLSVLLIQRHATTSWRRTSRTMYVFSTALQRQFIYRNPHRRKANIVRPSLGSFWAMGTSTKAVRLKVETQRQCRL